MTQWWSRQQRWWCLQSVQEGVALASTFGHVCAVVWITRRSWSASCSSSVADTAEFPSSAGSALTSFHKFISLILFYLAQIWKLWSMVCMCDQVRHTQGNKSNSVGVQNYSINVVFYFNFFKNSIFAIKMYLNYKETLDRCKRNTLTGHMSSWSQSVLSLLYFKENWKDGLSN